MSTNKKTTKTFKDFVGQVIKPQLTRTPEQQVEIDRKSSMVKAVGAGVFSSLMVRAAGSLEHKAKEARIFADALDAIKIDLVNLAETGGSIQDVEQEMKVGPNPFTVVEEQAYILTRERGKTYYYGPMPRSQALAKINSREGLDWDLVGSCPADQVPYSLGVLVTASVDKITK